MMKNVKRMFFVLTLITLLATVGAVCAADDANGTAAVDSSVSDVTTVSETASDTVATEPVATSDDNKVDTKTIEKEEKNLKTATKSVEVNNYDELITEMNNAVEDEDNDEYIITLNEGTYQINSNVKLNTSTYQPNIIINGYKQVLTATSSDLQLIFNNSCNITFNDVIINHEYVIEKNNNLLFNNTIINVSIPAYSMGRGLKNSGNVTLVNSILEATIPQWTNAYGLENSGYSTFINSTINGKVDNSNYENVNECALIISDDTEFGEKFEYNGNGKIIINDTSKIAPYLSQYNGTYTLKNQNITSYKINYGNLTIINCTIDNIIINYGTLIISDDTIFGPNFSLMGSGDIIINDTSKILTYLTTYDGNYTLENINITSSKTNTGNLTIINCILANSLDNQGNLTIINSTLNSQLSHQAYTNGYLVIDDDTIINPTFSLIGDGGRIIMNNTERIVPYLSQFNGTYTIENLTITKDITNHANLTINNAIINKGLTNNGILLFNNSEFNYYYLTNNGNLTLENTFFNKTINNYQNLIIGSNVTLGDGCSISGNGNIISDDINNIFTHISVFTGDTVISLGDYSKVIQNSGNLTIENSTMNNMIINNVNSNLTFNNVSLMNDTTNNGLLTLNNTTLSGSIRNNGILVISDDSIIADGFVLIGNGTIIINDTQRIADFLTTYTGNITLNNKTIDTNKTNQDNLTLNDCIINSTIKNDGTITIDDNTIFGENAKITGNGEIITNNITRILPYIDTINGNHTITDVTLNKSYTFNGNVTLNNVNITNTNNANFGTLTLTNCSVDVGEGNNFIDNFGNLIIRNDTEIIGEINDMGGQTSYTDAPKVYVVNNRTVSYFFDNTGLTSMVNAGDTLDFQGTISGVTGVTFIINKPINIITTTNDGKIDDVGVINFTKESSGSNVTGLYTHNTQFYVWNANHIVFDNISNVVENKRIGWGVGQTSIRENSSYITVKNSYFYTKDNGGSSTLVLAWADNCIIENNTIEGNGTIGNMLYITTYNVDIPSDIIFNSHNKLINNTINGPENAQATCYGICFCGIDNIIDGNTITYTGIGITKQWGSGIDGVETEESAFNSRDNIVSNNKLYGGCGINAGDIIYNNYMEGQLATENIAYNNTANSAYLQSNGKLFNNTITGPITMQTDTQSAEIINNTINGNINIPQKATNITITGNNITGTITLNGSSNIITNNNITTNDEYTITTRKSNNDNIITDNYLIAKTLTGDKSVNLNKDTNTIENNMPYENILKLDTTEFTAGQNTTITASIYYGNEINTTINKGKVTFKVNGKTLKDTNGKVIYAKVVNGTATIENYAVPTDWAKDGTTIQAVYSGSTQCDKLTSEKSNITIIADEPTLTTEDVTTTAGGKITLKATITDNDKVINTGKIVFKINGKTVKDENGKVIYAKVVNNTVEFEYTLPESYKAGSYNITATFISADYDRLTDSKTLTVNA